GGERNDLASAGHPHVATAMTLQAVAGGAQASGRPAGGLQTGAPADIVVLDGAHVALQELSPSDMLSAHVFGSHRTSAIDALYARGVQRVSRGAHPLHDAAARAFVTARGQGIH